MPYKRQRKKKYHNLWKDIDKLKFTKKQAEVIDSVFRGREKTKFIKYLIDHPNMESKRKR